MKASFGDGNLAKLLLEQFSPTYPPATQGAFVIAEHVGQQVLDSLHIDQLLSIIQVKAVGQYAPTASCVSIATLTSGSAGRSSVGRTACLQRVTTGLSCRRHRTLFSCSDDKITPCDDWRKSCTVLSVIQSVLSVISQRTREQEERTETFERAADSRV